jgi:hypothetical protein
VGRFGKAVLRALPGGCHRLCGVLEPVVSPEQLIADGHGRNASHASLYRLVRGVDELLLDGLALNRLEHRVWMELTGRCGEQDCLDVAKTPAGVELLAKVAARRALSVGVTIGQPSGQRTCWRFLSFARRSISSRSLLRFSLKDQGSTPVCLTTCP